MLDALLPDIVKGMFAVAGSVITFFLKKVYEQSSLKSISKDRQIAVTGSWIGSLRQDPDTPLPLQPQNTVLCVELRARRKKVSGNLTLSANVNDKSYLIRFELDGGFRYDRFLKLDYVNSKESVIQFGSLVVELSDQGDTLQGKYSGYGHISKAIVSGRVELSKVP